MVLGGGALLVGAGEARGAEGNAAAAALQAAAAEAFSRRNFPAAEAALGKLVLMEDEPAKKAVWIEGLAMVRTDAKRFQLAIDAFSEALRIAEDVGDAGAIARLSAGRGLAYEGIYEWTPALADYERALLEARQAGFKPDPYVVNSRANVWGSLGRWEEARKGYLEAADLFQGSRGYRNGASTTSRLDGAIYASSNAALALAELGNTEGALREARAVARRAPNSADMRAAVAAFSWALGAATEAEDAWNSACEREGGCERYRDKDFLLRIRRWPPRAVALLDDFLRLSPP